MNKTYVALLILSLAGFTASACLAQAQETAPDCKNVDNLDQASINECTYLEFEAADKELNAVYKKARALMQSWDELEEVDRRGAVKAMTEGQRGWVAYRDGYCTAYGFQAHGGSLEPDLVYGCKRDVTRARVKELQTLLD